MIDKIAVTQVFDALGPEHVGRGLAARRHTWADCFLALAYGARGDLDRALDDGLRGAARLFRLPQAAGASTVALEGLGRRRSLLKGYKSERIRAGLAHVSDKRPSHGSTLLLGQA